MSEEISQIWVVLGKMIRLSGHLQRLADIV